MATTPTPSRYLFVIAALALMAACADRDPPTPEPSQVATAAVRAAAPDPPSPPPAAAETCKVDSARAVRWLGSKAHTPLAIVDDAISPAPKACCVPWRDKARVWTTVDAHGRPVGKARIEDDSYYDVTDCHEPVFEQIEGDPGVGLYAAADGGYRAPPPRPWTPGKAELAALETFAEALDALVGIEPPQEPELEVTPLGAVVDRAVFFRSATGERKGGYVAVGGLYLFIASTDGDGRWRLEHVEQSEFRFASSGMQVYRVLAAFDMDGNGDPEVIVHETTGGGEGFRDMILTNEGGPGWRLVLYGIGGASI